MKAIAIENYSRISGGGTDSEIKMQSEGASVFCPNNVCPSVVVSGPTNYGNASVGLSDTLWGIAGGTAFTVATTFVVDSAFVAAGVVGGIVAAPVAVPLLIGGAGAVLAAVAAQGIANFNNGAATATIGKESWGTVSQP